jgi:hypothetical protein
MDSKCDCHEYCVQPIFELFLFAFILFYLNATTFFPTRRSYLIVRIVVAILLALFELIISILYCIWSCNDAKFKKIFGLGCACTALLLICAVMECGRLFYDSSFSILGSLIILFCIAAVYLHGFRCNTYDVSDYDRPISSIEVTNPLQQNA